MTFKESQEKRVETISESLSKFSLALQFDQIPTAVSAQAKLHMLDAIGIGIASSSHDFAKKTLHALMSLQEGNDQQYPVLGVPDKLSMRDAILVNGTFIHGLDFDDTHAVGVIHASSSANPLSQEEVLRRFGSNVEGVMSHEAANSFTKDFLKLEHQQSLTNILHQLRVH